jgi:predicted phage terminase large subunit-like protein
VTAVAIDPELDTMLEMLAAAEARETAQASTSFLDSLPPRVVRYRHVEEIAGVLQKCADGEIKRLMIFAPPRLGKSTLAREFAGYLLRRYPKFRGMLASYGKTLAALHTRGAKDAFVARGGVLSASQAEKADWETSEGGGMLGVGIGSGATGYGADFRILDDSVKDPEEAGSDAIAQRNHDWYNGVWDARSEGFDLHIIITTRWPGQADLATYALLQESGDAPEGWYIIALDAERDATEWKFPPSCTVHPDWREPGELLCEERVPREKLRKAKARSTFLYNALYQQRPTGREGKLFKWDDFVQVTVPPNMADIVTVVRYWDMAGTDKHESNDPDATSGVLMARLRDDSYIVLHRARKVCAVAERDALIRTTAAADRATYGRRCVQWFEQQAGIGGEAAMQAIVRMLAGHTVKMEAATGSKLLRADPFASQVQVKNVKVLVGDWTDGYLLELCGFPFAAHDDDVDASSGAFDKCADAVTTTRTSTLAFG